MDLSLNWIVPAVIAVSSGLAWMAFKDRREITVARSWQRYLENDQTAFKITERIDINVHALSDTSNAGPVVGLQLTAASELSISPR